MRGWQKHQIDKMLQWLNNYCQEQLRNELCLITFTQTDKELESVHSHLNLNYILNTTATPLMIHASKIIIGLFLFKWLNVTI